MLRRYSAFFLLLLVTTTGCGVSSHMLTAEREVVAPKRPIVMRTFLSPTSRAAHRPTPDPRVPRLDLNDSPEVQRELSSYTSKHRPFITDGLSRGERYLGLIETVFLRHQVPLELAAVAHVESRFISTARSPSGAVGMWQFMNSSARHFGLQVGKRRDDRTDVGKSTEAAARYLKELYQKFDDWQLALAAYNGGPARVQKAIDRCGTKDVFALGPCGLRQETLRFVAKVIAIAFITRSPDLYGFESDLDPALLRLLKLRTERSLP